jgi:hypothetical protein
VDFCWGENNVFDFAGQKSIDCARLNTFLVLIIKVIFISGTLVAEWYHNWQKGVHVLRLEGT